MADCLYCSKSILWLDPNRIKVISILGFSSIIFALSIILRTPTSTRYEISLYDAYPLTFWLSIILALFCSIVILVSQSFFSKKTCIYGFGALLLVIIDTLMVFQPLIRGYKCFGRDDAITHMGYINDILFTGSILVDGQAANIYPAGHILGFSLVSLSDLSLFTVMMIIPGFFFLLYIMSMYALARKLSLSDGQALLVWTFACLPLYKMSTTMFVPSNMVFFLSPMIFYLFFKLHKSKVGSTQIFLLLLLILLVLPIFHPGEGFYMLLILFLLFEILFAIFNIFYFSNINTKIAQFDDLIKLSRIYDKRFLFAIIFLIVVGLIWSFQFYRLEISYGNYIIRILEFSIGGESKVYDHVVSVIPLVETIKIFFNIYGQLIIYSLIGVVSLLIACKAYLSRKMLSIEQFVFGGVFLFSVLVAFISLFINIYVPFDRVVNWIFLFSSILGGLTIYNVCRHNYYSVGNIISILVIITLVISSVFCVFNLYYSPIVKMGNHQVTHMEIDGMEFFFTERDESISIYEEGIWHRRYASMLYGVSALPSNIRSDVRPPVHFGYLDDMNLAESVFGTTSYLLITELGRINFPKIIPEYKSLWLFTPSDYYRLDSGDPTVSKILFNGDFSVYYICS